MKKAAWKETATRRKTESKNGVRAQGTDKDGATDQGREEKEWWTKKAEQRSLYLTFFSLSCLCLVRLLDCAAPLAIQKLLT